MFTMANLFEKNAQIKQEPNNQNCEAQLLLESIPPLETMPPQIRPMQSYSYNYYNKRRHNPIDNRPFHCSICGKSFGRKSILTMHIKIHNNDRPFKCPFENCNKAFIDRTALKMHVNRHKGIKPHKCSFGICQKSFVTGYELQRHIRRVHQNLRPYKCSYESCQKAFGTKHMLTLHFRQHTGEKPFECPTCNKKFTSKNSLKHHKKKKKLTKQYIKKQKKKK
eukprot:511355_1